MNKMGATKDLNKSEEVVLVKIALNPELSGEDLKDRLDTDAESFSDCVDTLIHRRYVELKSPEDEYNWEVTDLGRMALDKFATVLNYDLRYAKEVGADKKIVNKLNNRKLMFERALNASKNDEEETVDGSQQGSN